MKSWLDDLVQVMLVCMYERACEYAYCKELYYSVAYTLILFYFMYYRMLSNFHEFEFICEPWLMQLTIVITLVAHENINKA